MRRQDPVAPWLRGREGRLAEGVFVWVARFAVFAPLAMLGIAVWIGGTPTALAEDSAPGDGKLIAAWHPRYRAVELQQARDNEGGPVELPHPIEKPEMHTAWVGATPAAPDSGKLTTLGAMPAGRGASAGFDPAASAERRIQRVIRRLG